MLSKKKKKRQDFIWPEKKGLGSFETWVKTASAVKQNWTAQPAILEEFRWQM